MLGPILFNVFLNDLFLILNEIGIAIYVNDNTLYKACDKVFAAAKTLRMLVE